MKNPQPLICLFVAAAILSSCSNKQADPPKEKDKLCISDSMEKMIRIDTAGITNVNDELKLSGEISFNDNKVVKVFPFSSGKVVEVKVSMGDRVVKGQVLAVIKSADVAGNYSDLSTAGNDLAIAKRQLDNEE